MSPAPCHQPPTNYRARISKTLTVAWTEIATSSSCRASDCDTKFPQANLRSHSLTPTQNQNYPSPSMNLPRLVFRIPLRNHRHQHLICKLKKSPHRLIISHIPPASLQEQQSPRTESCTRLPFPLPRLRCGQFMMPNSPNQRPERAPLG